MSDKPSNAGVVIALLPDETYTQQRPTTSDHHLTVLYMGKYSHEDITDKALKGYWKSLTELWVHSIPVEVTAEAMFDTPDGWAHVDLIDGPLLPDFRGIAQELLPVHGLPLNGTHGFLPHITRRYIKQDDRNHIEFMQRRGNKLRFELNRVVLWAGDTRFERPLGR